MSRQEPGPVQVFVVGTGRSGTKTVAELLDTPLGCRVEHERSPKLLGQLIAYLQREMTELEMVELLTITRSASAVGGERLSGEANQRLSFLLPPLAQAFPRARIVWLIRDGRDTVASLHHRQLYHPREEEVRSARLRPWAATRVRGDTVGEFSPEDWARLDGFSKCCWYWSFTNRLIERDLARTGLSWARIRLEELDQSLPSLAAFLELGDILPTRPPWSNKASRTPLGWRRWSRNQRDAFDRLCGTTMDANYPGWRNEMVRRPWEAAEAAVVRAFVGLKSSLGEVTRPIRVRPGRG